MNRTVRVGLEDRAYDVVIGAGLLDQAGTCLRPLFKRPRTAVVTDETVWALHGARLTAALEAAGIACHPIVMPPGEPTKSWEGLAEVSDRLLREVQSHSGRAVFDDDVCLVAIESVAR